MDSDRIKGKIDDIKGRVKRQAGEWTGDEQAQSEGMMDQAKGKVQNAFGKMKDAGRDVADDIKDRDRDEVRRREKDEAA
ncbi:MAG TPA: CsbD family protein [Terriglobales bacterium]|nr:CsbD family protein [Terriglobales bacterium]